MSPSGPNVSWVAVGVSQYSGGQCETPHLKSASHHQHTGPAEQQTPLPGEILKYKYTPAIQFMFWSKEIGIKVDYNINMLKELLLLGVLTDM